MINSDEAESTKLHNKLGIETDSCGPKEE